MTDELERLPPIARALAQIPDGKKGALLAVVTTDGAEVGFVARFNNTWSVEAGAAWRRGEKTIARVQVRATW